LIKLESTQKFPSLSKEGRTTQKPKICLEIGEVRSKNQIKIEVMEIVKALIDVLVIIHRNIPNKDPETSSG
jgi:hypothetical protein